MLKNKKTKIIFLTGGVYSSLGKGIFLSSLGKVLQQCGYKISVLKIDPYFNINSGLLSPVQHGEVYVTYDGSETDLDLGHYERFLNEKLSKESCITSGKIYMDLINKERKSCFGGETLQLVPHFTNEIHNQIFSILEKNKGSDFLLIEIGGTVGDDESVPFLMSAKQFASKYGKKDVFFMHLVPIIFLKNTQEPKTKPAQHSLKNLLKYGVTPDLVILKHDKEINKNIKDKIFMNSGIPCEDIVSLKYQKSIYLIPGVINETDIHKKILNYFNLESSKANMLDWEKFTNKIISIENQIKKLKVLIVGKYTTTSDSYISIIESLKFASYELNVKFEFKMLNSEKINNDERLLKGYDAICVPPGFGIRGIEGKIFAIKFARENNIPFLGICFGMQIACIEYARNVLNIHDADSIEVNKNSKNNIFIALYKDDIHKMRLGEKKIFIEENSKSKEIYGSEFILERHRHKYHFNNDYYELFKKDNIFEFDAYSFENEKIIEIISIKNHKFFVGVQFHPEFSSTTLNVNKIFVSFLKSAINKI